MIHTLRNFKNGIQNLYRWFPVIWKDRYWDYTYLLVLIQFKMKLMSKEFRKAQYSDDSIRSADKIGELLIILERMIEDSYYDPAEALSLPNEKLSDFYAGIEKTVKTDYNDFFRKLGRSIRYWWD